MTATFFPRASRAAKPLQVRVSKIVDLRLISLVEIDVKALISTHGMSSFVPMQSDLLTLFSLGYTSLGGKLSSPR